MKILLFILICAVTLTSLFCGLIMINNPKGDVLNLPPDILATTPFTDFKMPGILLTVMVGLPGLVSVFYYIQDNMRKYDSSVLTGVTVSLWITAQVIWTRTIHWQDLVMFSAGMMIILLAYQIKGKWVV